MFRYICTHAFPAEHLSRSFTMQLKASLLVLLAVLAAVASAWNSLPVVVGLCKHSSILGDLNPQQFFNNKWYVWKTHGGFLFDRSGSCAGMDSKVQGGIVQLLNYQYEPLLGRYVTSRGGANAAYIQKKGLTFPVDFELGGMNFTLGFNILGTDYDSWAAVYLCHQLVGLKIEMSWIAVRDRDVALTPQQKVDISEAISNVGFSLEDYEFKYSLDCAPNEPHL